LRASSLETLRNLAEAGYGVTVLPELALGGAARASAGTVVRPFRDPGLRRRVRLVYRPHAPRSAALAALVREALPAHLRPSAAFVGTSFP
jgi:LysR family hydrogen peroxide-inducible transcriptional activator